MPAAEAYYRGEKMKNMMNIITERDNYLLNADEMALFYEGSHLLLNIVEVAKDTNISPSLIERAVNNSYKKEDHGESTLIAYLNGEIQYDELLEFISKWS